MKNTAIKGKYVPKNTNKFSAKDAIYRSLWERRFMLYCDRNKNILEWSSENIVIPYTHPKDNKLHNYYPDFYIKYINVHGNTVEKIIEIKPKWQCNWSVNRAKWIACRKACKQWGYKFQVLTEKELF